MRLLFATVWQIRDTWVGIDIHLNSWQLIHSIQQFTYLLNIWDENVRMQTKKKYKSFSLCWSCIHDVSNWKNAPMLLFAALKQAVMHNNQLKFHMPSLSCYGTHNLCKSWKIKDKIVISVYKRNQSKCSTC